RSVVQVHPGPPITSISYGLVVFLHSTIVPNFVPHPPQKWTSFGSMCGPRLLAMLANIPFAETSATTSETQKRSVINPSFLKWRKCIRSGSHGPGNSFNSQNCQGIYRKNRAIRGGGESGSNDRMDSVCDKVAGPPVELYGREMVTGSGSTKITAVVRSGPLSWEQDIEQLTMALPPRCSQSIGIPSGAARCGVCWFSAE